MFGSVRHLDMDCYGGGVDKRVDTLSGVATIQESLTNSSVSRALSENVHESPPF